jgi:hypothetical protein
MFSPEDCIGIEATDYLMDLGFDFSVDSEYVGDVELDLELLGDDANPEHSAALEELFENTEMHICCTMDQHHLKISWSSAEILSVSDNFPAKILSTLKAFLENGDSIVYISNEKLVKMQEKMDAEVVNQD